MPDTIDKPYTLVTTYTTAHNISTAYRKSSAIDPIWYFETTVFKWDSKYRKRTGIVEQSEASTKEDAVLIHMEKAKEFI